jgi:hypothetical protein
MKINVCDTHDCSEMTCDIEESSDYENLWKNKTKAGLLTSIKDRHQNLHFSFFFLFCYLQWLLNDIRLLVWKISVLFP